MLRAFEHIVNAFRLALAQPHRQPATRPMQETPLEQSHDWPETRILTMVEREGGRTVRGVLPFTKT